MILQLVPFILIFVIMWFLIIRPQQRRVKKHQEMIKNVRRGDTVVTSGGIIGKVTKVTEDSADIEVEIAERREGQGGPRHDLRRAHQGRAGQGLIDEEAGPRLRMGRLAALKQAARYVRKVELTMLRFSRSKIIATVAIIVIGLLLAVPSMMTREQRRPFQNALPSWVPSWLVPVPRHRARPRPAGRLARPARGRRAGPDAHPDHDPARRRPPHPARDPRVAAGRHPDRSARRPDPRAGRRRPRPADAAAAGAVAADRQRRPRPGRRQCHRRSTSRRTA